MSIRRVAIFVAMTTLYVFTVSPTLANATRIGLDDFDTKTKEFAGEDWKLTRYVKQDGDSGLASCFVRFEAGGEVLHDFRCSPVRESSSGQLDWTSVYHYTTPDDIPDLMAVLWYEGGAHSAYKLRVISLADGFPMVFDSNGTSFGYMEDLDGDGMPEIVAASFAFDYFYASAIMFSHVDSTYGTLIATYTKATKKFMWANSLFPDVLQIRKEESKEAFLNEWPNTEKIPITIAVEQRSSAAAAYRAMIRWAIHTAYADGEAESLAIIDQYTDPALAVFAKHAFHLTLRNDPNYTFMLDNPVAR